jgi:hypothetical protein
MEISCFSEFSRFVPIPVFPALYGPFGAAFFVESAINDVMRYAVLQSILGGQDYLIFVTGFAVIMMFICCGSDSTFL